MTSVARNRESSSQAAAVESSSNSDSAAPATTISSTESEVDRSALDGDASATPQPAPEELIEDLGNIFKLLADETRLRILFYLARRGELHVRALCELLGQSQPAVSHHLAMLRTAGMIEPRRDGKHNFYRVLPEAFEHLVDLVFEAIPHSEDSIRFESYELSFRRPSQPR